MVTRQCTGEQPVEPVIPPCRSKTRYASLGGDASEVWICHRVPTRGLSGSTVWRSTNRISPSHADTTAAGRRRFRVESAVHHYRGVVGGELALARLPVDVRVGDRT